MTDKIKVENELFRCFNIQKLDEINLLLQSLLHSKYGQKLPLTRHENTFANIGNVTFLIIKQIVVLPNACNHVGQDFTQISYVIISEYYFSSST